MADSRIKKYVLEIQKGTIKSKFTSNSYMTLVSKAVQEQTKHVYIISLFMRITESATGKEIFKMAFDMDDNIITGANIIEFNKIKDFIKSL